MVLLAAITVNYAQVTAAERTEQRLIRVFIFRREAHAPRDYLPDALGPVILEIKNAADGRGSRCALTAMRFLMAIGGNRLHSLW